MEKSATANKRTPKLFRENNSNESENLLRKTQIFQDSERKVQPIDSVTRENRTCAVSKNFRAILNKKNSKMSLVWCLVRWIINDRKKERQRMQHIKINASKKMHMQKQLARSISDIEVQKQLARSISDIEAQKQIASVDTTDGSGSDDDFDNRYKVKIERPLFFRVISWWAYLELMIIAYVMLTKPLEDFPDNFLNGLCHNHQCQRIITRALCYKILSSVFLAFGAKLVS